MQVAQDREAVFQIGFELDVAGLIQIAVFRVGRAVTARPDASDRESPDTVGAADIELFAVRSRDRIAVAVCDSGHQASYQVLLLSEIIVVPYFAC